MIRGLIKLVLALVLIVVVGTGGLLGWIVVRGFPQRDGVARLPGVSGDVTVERDANGIPQIYAPNVHDLFAAQGYVEASERMWQMEVWRRIGSGRLSELFGSSQLQRDEFIRTLGWRLAAQADWAAASPETRQALQAYADGVNAWLGAHHDLSLPFVVAGLLGAGGGLGGFQPEPWTPIDSLTWQKVQAWSLGGNFDTELFKLLADAKLDSSRVDELFPAYPSDGPVIVPTGAPGSGGAGADLAPSGGGAAESARDVTAAGDVTAASGAPGSGLGESADSSTSTSPFAPALDQGEAAGVRRLIAAVDDLRGVTAALNPLGSEVGSNGLGSNSFAVAGSRSKSGHAMLANDPHLSGPMPSLWYLVGLHCQPVGQDCPYDLAGASFPGVPGIVLGHNAQIAWGLTNVNPDVEDVFAEKLDPANPDAVIYKGASAPMTIRTETIKVKGAPDVTLRVRSTIHGPVISDVVNQLEPTSGSGGGLGASGYVYSLEHTATAQLDHTLDGILGVNRATDWNSFRDALRSFGAPSQTFLYADVKGNIGVQIPGLIPIRASGDGSRVSPGDGSADWSGFIPFDSLPYLYDPPSGVIVTANNAPVDARFPLYLGSEWDPGWRAARIRSLIGNRTGLTLDDLVAIQGDVTLTRADPLVAAAGAPAVKPATADGRAVQAAIAAWAKKETCTTDSAGCAAYETFETDLLRTVFDDALGAGTEPDALASMYVGSDPSRQELRALLQTPNAYWWGDNSPTPGFHDPSRNRDSDITEALDNAGADLRSALGDPSNWTWGKLHTVSFQEQTFGTSGIGPLEWAFDKGPYPAAGTCDVPDAICGSISALYPDPYATTASAPTSITDAFAANSLPSYRLVIDMGDLDGARFIQSTGQSGVPFDSHYGDFIDRWLAVQALPIPFTHAAVDAARQETLILTP